MTPRRFAMLTARLSVWTDYLCAAVIGTGLAMLATILIGALPRMVLA